MISYLQKKKKLKKKKTVDRQMQIQDFRCSGYICFIEYTCSAEPGAADKVLEEKFVK